jgi:hypothetical protein
MKTTTLYEDRGNVKTKITLLESKQINFITIYQYDDEGYVEQEIRIFNPETVEALTTIFKNHPDYVLYNSSDDLEPGIRFFRD